MESFQDDTDLLFWSVLSAGCGADLSNEGPGLLGASLSPLVYAALGYFGSFHDADTLYPASGALTTSQPSGFIPSKYVPFSLTFYSTGQGMMIRGREAHLVNVAGAINRPPRSKGRVGVYTPGYRERMDRRLG